MRDYRNGFDDLCGAYLTYMEFIGSIHFYLTGYGNLKYKLGHTDLYRSLVKKHHFKYINSIFGATNGENYEHNLDQYKEKFMKFSVSHLDERSIETKSEIQALNMVQSFCLLLYTINRYKNDPNNLLISYTGNQFSILESDSDNFLNEIEDRINGEINRLRPLRDIDSQIQEAKNIYGYLGSIDFEFKQAEARRIASKLAVNSELSQRDFLSNKKLLGLAIAHNRLRQQLRNNLDEISDKYLKDTDVKRYYNRYMKEAANFKFKPHTKGPLCRE